MSDTSIDDGYDDLGEDDDLEDDDGPVRHALARIEPLLHEQIELHPYRTVAGAALLGFAVGGGFSSRLGRFALMAAARYAARAIWRDIAASALETGPVAGGARG